MMASSSFFSPSLWSSLPPELLDLVLSFLPFPCLFRLRTVCRHWNNLPLSPYFRTLSPPWTPCLPVLFSQDPLLPQDADSWASDSWSAFNPSSHHWQRLPPLHPLDAQDSHPKTSSKSLVVGSGGLLCLGDFDLPSSLVVCNPMTRAARELPSTLGKWTAPDLTAMVVSPSGRGYQLVLAGNRGSRVEEGEYRRTEVYDSVMGAWEIAGKVPENVELHSQEGALCKGVLYCLARDAKRGAWNVLAGFDVRRRAWSVVSVEVPCGMRTPHVVAWRGLVLAIVELEGGDSQDDSRCAVLYEMNLVSKKWSELSRLPSEMYAGVGKRVVACTVDGDFICVTGCRANRWYSVMCRSPESKWQQVPSYPVEDSRGSVLLLSSSPFRPSLEPV